MPRSPVAAACDAVPPVRAARRDPAVDPDLRRYVMGLVRDRILTQTYGLEDGARHVQCGVPDPGAAVLGHRRQRPGGAVHPDLHQPRAGRRRGRGLRFGQTILTLAPGDDHRGRRPVRPRAADGRDRWRPASTPSQALYVELFRLSHQPGPVRRLDGPRRGPRRPSSVRVLRRRPAPLQPRHRRRDAALRRAHRHPGGGRRGDPGRGPCTPACARRGLRTTYRPRLRLELRTRDPRVLPADAPQDRVSPIEPITFLFFTSVASTLVAGSITTVGLARNFQSVPISLIGVAFALAAFPALAAGYAARDRAGSPPGRVERPRSAS